MNDKPSHEPVRGLRRVVYWVLAMLFLVLGILGVLLPGLPTTPFLLLMSYFLIQISPELHQRLLQVPLIGGPIRDWRERGGIRPGVKYVAVAMVLLVMAASLFWRALAMPVQMTICVLAAIGLIVIWRLPTI